MRYVSVMVKDDRVLCAFETLLQIQTNFNGIFVNLKLITEGQFGREVDISEADQETLKKVKSF